MTQNTSLHLQLTAEQGEALALVLENYLPDLRYEIADTDSNDFRHMLQRRQEALKQVLELVQQELTTTAG